MTAGASSMRSVNASARPARRPDSAAAGATLARRPHGESRRVRRSAGAYARAKRFELLLLLALGCGLLAGLGIGQALPIVVGVWFDGWPRTAVVSGTVLIAMGVFWWTFRSIERRGLKRLEKGQHAETYAGELIEYALTTPGCAVAHSVTGIPRVGEIDHLVATPLRLWIIETKYRSVPRDQLPEALRRIAENTAAVRKWAPPGTPVRPCLVLATGSAPKRKTYDYGTEPVVVHTPASLAHELKAEASKERMIDERVVAEVWKVGRVAE